MLLATYQPYVSMPEHRNDQYECFRGKLDGEYPVFCFPARSADEFRFRSLLAAPVKPERLILIDTDEYARFDAVEWNRILCLPVTMRHSGSALRECSMAWTSAFQNMS